jgi:hypothetical protein
MDNLLLRARFEHNIRRLAIPLTEQKPLKELKDINH